jgi:hypothetical protein
MLKYVGPEGHIMYKYFDSFFTGKDLLPGIQSSQCCERKCLAVEIIAKECNRNL